MSSLETYLAAVHAALKRALCIQCHPSCSVERQYAPEVEKQGTSDSNVHALAAPVLVRRPGERHEHECCFIESSINSCRVSLKLKAANVLEAELLGLQLRFLMQNAESKLPIVRKVPVPGYDLSFLVTDVLLVGLGREAIMQLVLSTIRQSESDVSSLKLAVNTRGRAVAGALLKSLAF